jgi:eukaryotic-like serine/threonine-protein kinase
MPVGHDVLADALRARYVLERELGHGGMATVYLARDLRYDRLVALKVLHAELAQALGPERFEREIRFAARLQHPHILTVLDSGEVGAPDGRGSALLWFTMPYVEGESLRDRLRREQQLPLEDAMQIGHTVALALEYAHEHGVVHRDIKPENILLTRDGSTLVADFGIARALEGGEANLTETGVVIGTPAYMSPEQAAGDPRLDPRTDIYSLGCVLYEMLAGEPPFTGNSPQIVMMRRLTESPRSLREVRDTVTPAMEQAVFKSLAKAPADRFASAAQLAHALQPAQLSTGAAAVHSAPGASASSPTVASRASAPVMRTRRRVPLAVTTLGLGFLVGLGVLFAWRRTQPDGAGAGPRRIAVLPFENLGAPDDQYFAEGVSDALRGKLAALPQLAVTARSSASQYERTNKPMKQVARELGVDYILTGTVRWAKSPGGQSRVEVSPELVEVAPGGTPRTRWQQPFGAAMTDVFQVQADIAGRVAQALDVALGDSAKRALAERPTASLPAYDAYLKGRSYEQRARLNVEPQTMTIARQQYQTAIAADSSFGLAWARLAGVHVYFFRRSPDDVGQRRAAEKAVERALALAPNSVEAHLAAGVYRLNIERDVAQAGDELRLALRADPNSAEALDLLSFIQFLRGFKDSSLTTAARAAALDPRSPDRALGLAQSLAVLRHWAASDSAYARAIELAPDQYHAYWERAQVQLLWQGDTAAARRIMQEAETRIGRVEFVKKMCVACFDWTGALAADYEGVLDQLSLAGFSPVDSANYFAARSARGYMHGDENRRRVYADSARRVLERLVRAQNQDPYRFVQLAGVYAALGRAADATASLGREAELRRQQNDTTDLRIDLAEQSARVLLLLGRNAEALDSLRVVLSDTTYPFTTPASARVDPFWGPLTGTPEFKRLTAAR